MPVTTFTHTVHAINKHKEWEESIYTNAQSTHLSFHSFEKFSYSLIFMAIKLKVWLEWKWVWSKTHFHLHNDN